MKKSKIRVFGQWILKQWERDDNPNFILQNLGIIFSIVFAILTFCLSIHLSKTDKKVDLLQSLIVKSDTIIDNLYFQNIAQNKQLEYLNKNYILFRDENIRLRQKVLIEYNKLSEDFFHRIYHDVIFNKEEFLRSSRSEKNIVLIKIHNIIDSILLNPVVYNNSNYNAEWRYFLFHFEHFEFINNNYSIDDNIKTDDKSLTSVRNQLQKSFDLLEIQLHKLESKIEEFEYLWQKKTVLIESDSVIN